MTPEVLSTRGGARGDAYEASLLTILAALARRWKLIVLLPLALAAVTVTSRLLSERQYAATSQFMPESPEQPARLAGLAAQLGISAGSSNSAESLEFYQFLLTSPDLLLQAAESVYRFTPAGGTVAVDTSLVDYYGLTADSEFERRRAIVRQLESLITVTLDRSAGLVTVETRALEPELAVQINQRLLELVGSFNLERRQTRARAEREFAAAQLERAQRDLESAERDLERFLEANRRYAESPSLRFEAGRLERRIAIQQEVYAALAQALEQARIEEVRNTPVISIISRPETSVRPVGRRTVLMGLLSLFAGFIVAVVLALILEYFAQYWREHPESAAILSGARRRPPEGEPRLGEVVASGAASAPRGASGTG